MRILVTGGAGFIGSHMVKFLARRGCAVTVLDDLSTGHRDAARFGRLVQGDIGDQEALGRLLDETSFDAAMHFAGKIQVAESVANPDLYFEHNVRKAHRFLQVLVAKGPKKLIFSSSASVYGEPKAELIGEDHPKAPSNPYGETKLLVEKMLESLAQDFGLRSVALRYFNAAGADPDGELGECHEPETHVIPLALRSANGTGGPFSIFGQDYPTRDGTCIRDFVHVEDLCDAHWLAIKHLEKADGHIPINVGLGRGFSVSEVLACAESVTGQQILKRQMGRRPGDPAMLVADSSLARSLLGWRPKYTDLAAIIATAYLWERSKAESPRRASR